MKSLLWRIGCINSGLKRKLSCGCSLPVHTCRLFQAPCITWLHERRIRTFIAVQNHIIMIADENVKLQLNTVLILELFPLKSLFSSVISITSSGTHIPQFFYVKKSSSILKTSNSFHKTCVKPAVKLYMWLWFRGFLGSPAEVGENWDVRRGTGCWQWQIAEASRASSITPCGFTMWLPPPQET